MTDHGHPSDDGEDGYSGPAELVAPDGAVAAAEVTLRGHFDPISGHYRWFGRVAAATEVARLLEIRERKVVLRTPHGEADTTLSDIDPWGRPRVEGFGSPPFPVVTSLDGDPAA